MSAAASIGPGNAVALPVAAAASLAVHAAMVGAVLWATRPLPMEPQAMPQSELTVEAYQVERTQAPEAQPDAEAARTDDTRGEAVGGAGVPASRAEPAAVPAERAAAAAPPADRAEAAPPRGEAAEAAAPEGDALKAAAPEPEGLRETPPPAETAAAAAAPAEALAPAEAAPETVAAAAAPVEAAPAAEAAAETARLTPAAAEPLAPAEAPAEAAAAVAPPAEALAPAGAPAEPAAAAAPPSEAAAPVEARSETAVAAPPPADRLAGAAPPAEAAPAAAPLGDAAEAVHPDTPPLAPAEAEAAVAPPAEAPREAAPEAPPQAEPAAPAVAETAAAESAALPAEKGKATLAPVGPDGELDPKSLDAIAAFMQPEDAAAGAAEVRDGIEGVLSAVPCSRLQVEYDPDSGALTLRGHIPEEGLRGPIMAALTQQIGEGIPVEVDVRILPRPQCGALAGIGDVGLPQSNDQSSNPRILGADAFAREFDYAGGAPLDLDLSGADYDAWVYVDYFDAGGNVIHLIPNDQIPLQLVPAGTSLDALRARDGRGPLGIVFGPPYGQEIAVAFAASVPLYEGLRPISEPASSYLAFLKERVAEARAADPAFKGEWVYFFITTHE